MSEWRSRRAKQVLTALFRIGWTPKRQTGSHRTLSKPGFPDFVFSFHDSEVIGPRMLARIGKRTGLKPEDL
jgi:predicted RNA binding protein YcfA (HicA-like mRNA interferase family)